MSGQLRAICGRCYRRLANQGQHRLHSIIMISQTVYHDCLQYITCVRHRPRLRIVSVSLVHRSVSLMLVARAGDRHRQCTVDSGRFRLIGHS